MRQLQLIHNEFAGPVPAALSRNRIIPADKADITTCGRCGNDVFAHLWILRNPDEPEQDGVIDCAGVG